MIFPAHYQKALFFQIHVPSIQEHSSESRHVPDVYPAGLDLSSTLEERKEFHVSSITFIFGLKMQRNYFKATKTSGGRLPKFRLTYIRMKLIE
jgi:hypothetical protein